MSGEQQPPTLDSVRDHSPGRSEDSDRALKDAIHAAVDAGLYDRARALLDVLTKMPARADVVTLRKV